MDTSHLTAEELRAFWRRHLEYWRTSGQSQAAYCHAHGLTEHRFRYWKQCLAPGLGAQEPPNPEGFLPVQLAAQPTLPVRADSGITVRLPTGLGLELRSGFDTATLQVVVQALSG